MDIWKLEHQTRRRKTGKKKSLVVALIYFHGTETYALFDTEATQNVVSPKLAGRLGLKHEKTEKSVTVAIGCRYGVAGNILDVSVRFEKLNVRIDFVVVKNVRFDPVIGRATLKQLRGVLVFESKEI